MTRRQSTTNQPLFLNSHESFKDKCWRLGVDYYRSLKRRQAGHPDETIFAEGYIRHTRDGNAVTVHGVIYPNFEEARRALDAPAATHTIRRWIAKGMAPEEAFTRIPNPGYANGIIYLITHRVSQKQYVGLTVQTLERRWQYHKEHAQAGKIQGMHSLHAAIREHGAEAFDVCQIDAGTTKQDLEQKERWWIAHYKTLIPHGYNISSGGVSGGSNKKSIVVDGIRFASIGQAEAYVAETRHINFEAASLRLRKNRLDVKTPAKPGQSVVKTKLYRVWSQIIHITTNPKAKDYIPGVAVHEPWRDFETFAQDVGQPASRAMVFVRLDKSRGFFPANCSWVTKSEAGRMTALHMKQQGLFIRKAKRQERHTEGIMEQLNLL